MVEKLEISNTTRRGVKRSKLKEYFLAVPSIYIYIYPYIYIYIYIYVYVYIYYLSEYIAREYMLYILSIIYIDI